MKAFFALRRAKIMMVGLVAPELIIDHPLGDAPMVHDSFLGEEI